MAKPRKTVDITSLIDKVNCKIARTKSTKEEREALALLLESILMDAGAYQGFNFIGWMNGGCDAWRKAGEPADNSPFIGDETRRFYYGGSMSLVEVLVLSH